MYKFKDFIDQTKLTDADALLNLPLGKAGWRKRIPRSMEFHGIWRNLCYNKNAVHIVEKYITLMSGDYLIIQPHLHDIIIEKYPHKIYWRSLCQRTHRIDFIEKHWDNIRWSYLSANPFAIDLLKKNQDKICWFSLSENPAAIDLIMENLEKINWEMLSLNPAAIELLKRNQNYIYWKYMTCNSAIWKQGRLLDWIDVDKLDLSILCKNPNAIYLMEQYPERICWYSATQNPKAVPLLRKNLDKIMWMYLSLNESREAIQLMEENMDKKDEWNNELLFSNPYIFEYDYEEIQRRCDIYKEELMQVCWHPVRVQRYLDMGYDILA